MTFSKAAFLASDSGGRLRTLVGSHLSVLDGMPVQDAGDGYGRIEYEAGGEDLELYPVMPEWCAEYAQINLFAIGGNGK